LYTPGHDPTRIPGAEPDDTGNHEPHAAARELEGPGETAWARRDNISSLETILRWNAERGIDLFRIGQGLIPFASHPAFPYDWEAEHGDELRGIGGLARELGIRLSMHPGQYINPGSPKPEVVDRSLTELRYVARVFSCIGSPDSVLVLHLGGAYDDRGGRDAALRRGAQAGGGGVALPGDRERRADLDRRRDRRGRRSLGVPAIVDTLHHALNPGGLTLVEALNLALPTWEARGVRPKLHLSSQDPEKRPGAHAYSVDLRDWHALLSALDGREADVMVEAKSKEHALVPMGVEIG
jgi:UV DNA damage endonuclease